MDEWMDDQNKKMYIQIYYDSCYESINQIYRSTIKKNRHGWMDGKKNKKNIVQHYMMKA